MVVEALLGMVIGSVVVGSIATAATKDVKGMLGGGAVGAIVGGFVGVMIRVSAALN